MKYLTKRYQIFSSSNFHTSMFNNLLTFSQICEKDWLENTENVLLVPVDGERFCELKMNYCGFE